MDGGIIFLAGYCCNNIFRKYWTGEPSALKPALIPAVIGLYFVLNDGYQLSIDYFARNEMSTNIDLTSLNRSELEQLQKDVEKAIQDYDARMRTAALKAVQEAAEEYGFSLEDLFELKSNRKGKAKVAPKYINPESPAETWTGRGRRPQWFQDALQAGKTPEDLAVS